MPNYNLKDSIKKTFQKLLQTHSIDEIDVQLICDTLKIKRQSFYYHFNNMYEVVLSIYEYKQLVLPEDFNLDSLLMAALDALYEQEDFNREILNSSCEEIVKNYVYAYFYSGFAGFFEKSGLSIDDKNEASRIVSLSICEEMITLFKIIEYTKNDVSQKIKKVFNEQYVTYFVDVFK